MYIATDRDLLLFNKKASEIYFSESMSIDGYEYNYINDSGVHFTFYSGHENYKVEKL